MQENHKDIFCLRKPFTRNLITSILGYTLRA